MTVTALALVVLVLAIVTGGLPYVAILRGQLRDARARLAVMRAERDRLQGELDEGQDQDWTGPWT